MDKPSWKSTEFWMTFAGVNGGIILSMLPESPVANIIGGILAAICGSSYTIGRSMVKSNKIKADISSSARSALIDAVKKKAD